MDGQSGRLEALVQQIGEAVLASTETIDKLSEHLDILAKQVQQQGYQIFALSDAVQTLAENQDAALARMAQVTETLQQFVIAIQEADDGEPNS
ncbi:hypothetical protein ACQ4M4_00820 [Leptolyngbya sp. AN02str]|uniref:hypothetical protein n=1 Tax=Leptolyngbya sp. AN02str TaxID=3423363 RepID=UPI003D314C58